MTQTDRSKAHIVQGKLTMENKDLQKQLNETQAELGQMQEERDTALDRLSDAHDCIKAQEGQIESLQAQALINCEAIIKVATAVSQASKELKKLEDQA